MNFQEILDELPSLSVGERQLLIRRALELDDSALSSEDEALVESRLAEGRRNPGSAVSLEDLNSRLRSRFSK